jgi:hypothetical protein
VDVPALVYIIWWVTLALAAFVILPLTVYLLHRALTAARQIERNAALALQAGLGVAGNTANIAALQQTISVATGIVAASRSIEERTGTVESVLASRAGR